MSTVLRLFSHVDRETDLNLAQITAQLRAKLHNDNIVIEEESCYYVVIEAGRDSEVQNRLNDLKKLLSQSAFEVDVKETSWFEAGKVVEIGPRLTFTSPFSTNAVSACTGAGIPAIARLERSRRYLIKNVEEDDLDDVDLLDQFGDKMTEQIYTSTPAFVHSAAEREDFYVIDLLSEDGAANLEKANERLGLAFDDDDKSYYLETFRRLKRNPTDVELFDMAQSNSEHSRHWFFKGTLVVDGVRREKHLFQTIQATQEFSNKNNVIAFCDNSSAIQGFQSPSIIPECTAESSQLHVKDRFKHIIYTAETHNFPTGVCPFPGAATGTGGRLRDVQATGRGASEVAGVVGYSFGNLHLADFEQAWEREGGEYPSNLAHPRKVLLDASNGASDYGNKFGEPVIAGFSRSFGQHLRLADGARERVEFVKPILFSGGMGLMEAGHAAKRACAPGQLVAKLGGPAHRIGLGGGAASSVAVQGGARRARLDYGAVQRGDPEMGQKVHRVVRACLEMADRNPILSIHDQGAGGNGNVLKEIVEGPGGGAIIYSDQFQLGDPTISVRELWGAEYQENDAILLDPSRRAELERIGRRERCPIQVVGEVTGNQKVVLKDFERSDRDPVSLDLAALAEREPKTFHLNSVHFTPEPVSLPPHLTVQAALDLVLRLPAVASKRFLTNKVDRSVTGLIAQQQCVGPLQIPLADCGVTAHSYFSTVGTVVGIGEQPIKGLANAEAGARCSVAEALTNLAFAPLTCLEDVKCSGNWMWAAKLAGEGARLVRACDAMCALMRALGVAVDGGKDSLSMAARVGGGVVKAPGTLVVSAYAPCPDLGAVAGPALQPAATLLWLPMHSRTARHRLAGSALAQCLSQVGQDAPDLDEPAYFKAVFNVVQNLLRRRLIAAGHDISDGGLLTTVLEMAFAGNCGIHLNFDFDDVIPGLFSEEVGVVVGIEKKNIDQVIESLKSADIVYHEIGMSKAEFGTDAWVTVVCNGAEVLKERLMDLLDKFEEVSDRMELLQTSEVCVLEQKQWRKEVKNPKFTVTFDYGNAILREPSAKPRVAILREEGSNGDREMAAAFILAGFDAFDLTMTDLIDGKPDLSPFQGIAFVGGFSYADVLGSAKGWAASIQLHSELNKEFERFRQRRDTFSLGVCNGCQLMALLGWVGDDGQSKTDSPQVFLGHNRAARFHTSFTRVRVEPTNAIMLKDMAGSVLGVWSAHGEGRFTYRRPEVLERLEQSKLIGLRYVDESDRPTQLYPANPNGSQNAVAGLCSPCGRHFCLMPHPDRAFLNWQWPDWPSEWERKERNVAPWIKMFENAFEWAQKQKGC